ncbi:hypothetical protein BSKO_00648 [Bryopsis sp. KO-2023]|nr:hypothetical protein BSKO_00648 [Bryopsis sp. KO-2023]
MQRSLINRLACPQSHAICRVERVSSPKWLRSPRRQCDPSQPQRPAARLVVCMGIRAVENFDSSFELEDESEATLLTLLRSDIFANQVCDQCGLAEGTKLEFSGKIFQPVPWSPTTPRGMPTEFEKYQDDPNYTVINVPPNFMFQAKIFRPSRLCAIYKTVSE